MTLPKVPPEVWGWVAVIVVVALALRAFSATAKEAAGAAVGAIDVGSRTNLASRAVNTVVGGLTQADDGVADSVGTWFYGLTHADDGYNSNPVVTARDRP